MLGTVLLAGILLYAGLLFTKKAEPGALVRISYDGRVIGELPLATDCVRTFTVNGAEAVLTDTADGGALAPVMKTDEDGKEAGSLSVSLPQADADGSGCNVIVIRDNVCKVTEADCPDGICVRHGGISHKGEAIICLPHRLVVEIAGDAEGGADAIAW